MFQPTTQLLPKARPRARRTGFLLADVIVGMFILALLTTVLLVSLNLRSKSMRKLESQRAALEQAERVLAGLQSGGVPSELQGSQLAVRRTGKRVGTMEWVEVSISREGRTAAITGLAPTTRGTQP